ncbi:MAG: hypothetical protein E7313_02470 [Clostridiales bacterium]|nr:hypothetical protein [Clostridiales bacterium]
MENNKKSTGKTVLVVLLLIITIVSIVLATYAWAKYTTTIEGNSTGVVAKWNVSGNVANEIKWSKTYNHVVAEKLAPGTSGVIPVTFGINDTEVDVKYTISIVSAPNKPTNLHFYEATYDGTTYTKGNPLTVTPTAGATTGVITDTIAHGAATEDKTATKYIYWEWPYTTGNDANEIAANDAIDTNEANVALTTDEDRTMTVAIKIDAVQVEPTTGTTNP